MRVGIMTGGGDAPGLNGIIEAVGRVFLTHDVELIGICDGFEGIFEGNVKSLTAADIHGIHAQAGTVLGASNKCDTRGRETEFAQKFSALELDGLIAAGGDGTFAGLSAFFDDIPIIGVPKTIDNDLPGTDVTFGYDTACEVVAEAVESLKVSANAHRRIIFVETMGRTAGWIALGGGVAAFAEVILIPERPFDPAALKQFLRAKQDAGTRGLVCVVAEGAHAQGADRHVAFTVEGSPEPERLGGIAQHLARWCEQELDWESRHVVLGHLQRSRQPTSTDRFLTSALGVEAATMALEGAWKQAVVYRDGRVQRAPLTDFLAKPRLVDSDHRWVKMCQALGSFI